MGHWQENIPGDAYLYLKAIIPFSCLWLETVSTLFHDYGIKYSSSCQSVQLVQDNRVGINEWKCIYWLTFQHTINSSSALWPSITSGYCSMESNWGRCWACEMMMQIISTACKGETSVCPSFRVVKPHRWKLSAIIITHTQNIWTAKNVANCITNAVFSHMPTKGDTTTTAGCETSFQKPKIWVTLIWFHITHWNINDLKTP